MTVTLVFAILVKQRFSQCREFVVINHHGEALGCMLSDEWVNDSEGLSRGWRPQHYCTSERIDDGDPTFVHLLLIIIDHRDIDGIFVFIEFFRLLKRFILEVKSIFAHTIIIVVGNTVESLMDEHCSNNR